MALGQKAEANCFVAKPRMRFLSEITALSHGLRRILGPLLGCRFRLTKHKYRSLAGNDRSMVSTTEANGIS